MREQEGKSSTAAEESASFAPELQPGDAYQEGPYLVFTAQYHLRRGFCCNSECRHCPYREISIIGEAAGL